MISSNSKLISFLQYLLMEVGQKIIGFEAFSWTGVKLDAHYIQEA